MQDVTIKVELPFAIMEGGINALIVKYDEALMLNPDRFLVFLMILDELLD